MKIINLFKKFEFYTSIDDLPIYNWFKIQETNNLKYLLKQDIELSVTRIKVLSTVMQDLRNEYINVFGIEEQHLNVLNLKKNIRIDELNAFITGDRIHNTMANIKRAELMEIISEQNSIDSASVIVHAKKYMGGNLNIKTTSVREFYSILNELKREVKAQKNG